MVQLPPEATSFWLDSTTTPGYPQLTEDVEVDVAIVGAGIVGLTSAYLLKKAGLRVAVVEKDTVSEGVSGHTTGKITSQHDVVYAKLHTRLGEEVARTYGQANEAALAQIADIVAREGIDCHFQRRDSYIYTTQQNKVAELRREAEIAAQLGLPAQFDTTLDLPFEIKGAVRFSNQASFHVREYLLALAKIVHGGGGYVHEQSHVIGLREGNPGRVRTRLAQVRAAHIIVATNVPTFPLMARGGYCLVEYPMQSYVVAGKVDAAPKGMYISPDSQHYSILPITHQGQSYILAGGEGHVPGTRLNTTARYRRLATYAQEMLGVQEISHRWTHRDYLGYDDMPLIGLLYPWSRSSYTATGFMKWGMTNGTMAAMLMSDMVRGQTNPWSQVFTPHRLKAVASIPKVVAEKLSGS